MHAAYVVAMALAKAISGVRQGVSNAVTKVFSAQTVVKDQVFAS